MEGKVGVDPLLVLQAVAAGAVLGGVHLIIVVVGIVSGDVLIQCQTSLEGAVIGADAGVHNGFHFALEAALPLQKVLFRLGVPI